MISNRISYSDEFDLEYAYAGDDLGVVCEGERTVFKVWAPVADKVELCFVNNDEIGDCFAMDHCEQGIWKLELSDNLHGTFYGYRMWYGDAKSEISPDPYARACSVNGDFSMVVDLAMTNPDGFAEEKSPAKQEETIIYELHIRDFSADPESGIPEPYRGKYKAFTVKARCTDYLKELGITHVHLLPFYDFGSIDESRDDYQYNWGYDPKNYNVPEGSYATDAYDGTVRIRECKEMIQALHQAGIRVVMDVVYNHTYQINKCFQNTAPGYYYRIWADGTISNGSGCGNDIAAGRAMVDRYILNSVLYWAKEYHIDGFRFDLMGLMTTELMNRIREELDRVYGPGEKLLYGEPWRAQDSPMEKGTYPATKEHIRKLTKGIAIFSDDTRDTIKGSVFQVKDPGFVNGAKEKEKDILNAVTGWQEGRGEFKPRDCSQLIQYVSAHDNYTLWDKLLISMKVPKRDYLYPYENVLKANKLAALICFTSQGSLFLPAGEEFGRTKFGDENSYRSGDYANMLRWGQTEVFQSLVSYYKGLISLRKKLPGLCDKSKEAGKRITNTAIPRENVVTFDVRNEGEWDILKIIYNASDQDYTLELPDGRWQLLADDERADIKEESGKNRIVPAHSGMICGKIKE